MPSPPFFKNLCRDISGEGTSAELMQCARSRVTQSLTSPAALPVLQDATPAILHDVPSAAAAGHCRVPEHLSPHNDTVSPAARLCMTHRSTHYSIFLTDYLYVLERSKGGLSSNKKKMTCCYCTCSHMKYNWGAFHAREKIIIISSWGSKQNPRFQRF